MAIDLNAEPYNDDFDESKNFYQILFKPGYSVQARELTQLQTILRDQVKKFGNHIFKHGSVVIPGHSRADIGVPYLKLESTYNTANVQVTSFIDKPIVGATSGVKAVVKKSVAATSTDALTFYVNYTSGGNDGRVAFEPGEEIYLEADTSVRATVKSGSDAIGVGSLAHISSGVFYINGSFVYVEGQTVVLTGEITNEDQTKSVTKYTTTPSCHVLLKIVETVVDFNEDETLLDNAQGAYNYAAPGADRLKIALELTTLPLGTTLTNDYVEIMRYRDGVLEEHAKNARYSELEKSLARRTYDESGNYVVSGLRPELREHLKKDLNEGLYAPSAGGDSSKFVVDVTRGKAYIQGFETEKIANTRLVADKARTAEHIISTSMTLRPNFGQYMVISNPTGAFSVNNDPSSEFGGGTVIDLYDTAADLEGNTGWSALTLTSAGTVYATDAGRLYAATNVGVTGPTAPDHTTTTGDATNADLWTANTQLALNSYVYYADRLYKVTGAGVTGLNPPTNTGLSSEVNAAQGIWDNYRTVSIDDTVYYTDRRKDPDVSSLYKVVALTDNPVPAGTSIVTGHGSGIWGGALATGTASTTIALGGEYNSTPTVVISAPDNENGIQAVATATLTGTAITAIDITTAGTGYTQPPVITIVKASGDTGAGGASVTYTGSITSYATGVEPRFLAGATISGITQYVSAAPSAGSGNGTITATVSSASTIANLQVGEFIKISGAVGTQQSKLNGTWVVASKPSSTTFTFYTSTTPSSGTYNTGLGTCETIGRMVNAKLWQSAMEVNKGDYIWVPGSSGKPNRVYLVDSVASAGSSNGGLTNVLGTSAPTQTNTSSTVNGSVYLVYKGAPACFEYAGTPTVLTHVGVPAKFKYLGVTGEKIGSARIIGVDYLLGNPGTTAAIYKLWVTDVKLSGHTVSLDDVGAIKYNGGADNAYALTTFDAPVNNGVFQVGEQIVHATSGRTAIVKYWDAPTGTLYAYRSNSAVSTPMKGDEIKGFTSNTTSVVKGRSTFTTAGQSSLIFDIPKEIPYSLKKTDSSSYDYEYYVQKELTIEYLNGSGGTSQSISSGTILPIEVGSFLALGEDGVIPNSAFTLNNNATAVIASAGAGLDTQTIKIYCTVLKKNLGTPKTKTSHTYTEYIKVWAADTPITTTAPGGGPQKVYYGSNLYVVTSGGTLDADVPPTHTSGSDTNGTATLKYVGNLSSITLDKSDVTALLSVRDTIGDITANYTITSGQTDYAYLFGTLNKTSGRPNPTGNFEITYTYYMHGTVGDFFCVDSYAEGNIENALDKRVRYQSISSGKTYDLISSIDFRPSIGEDGVFSPNDLIISGTTFSSSLRFYVPRVDALVMDKSGDLSLVKGTPSETTIEPTIPEGLFELNRFYIPAFTRSVKDIQVKRMDVERFTMRDIKQILNRVERIEEFSTMTASEVAVASYEIKDAATGLNRFKSGYLVESFKDPFTIARTTAGDYAASFVGQVLAAPIEELICDLRLVNQTQADTLDNGNTSMTSYTAQDNTFVIKGGCLMLPYTETPFAQQPLSSRVTNLNPFLVIRWDGTVECYPATDQWVEILELPTIFESVVESVTYTWWSPVPYVSQVLVHSGIIMTEEQRQVKPAPIQLVAYRITQPDGQTYTTVGAPGKYEKEQNAQVEVIGSTTINQRSDGVSTVRAIDNAAKRLGGQGVIVTDDIYKQISGARTTDVFQISEQEDGN